jgi:hypothetical protein
MKSLNEFKSENINEAKYPYISKSGDFGRNHFETMLFKVIRNALNKYNLKGTIRSNDWSFADRIDHKGYIIPITIKGKDDEIVRGSLRLDDNGKVSVETNKIPTQGFYSSTAVGSKTTFTDGPDPKILDKFKTELEKTTIKALKSFDKILGDRRKAYDEENPDGLYDPNAPKFDSDGFDKETMRLLKIKI